MIGIQYKYHMMCVSINGVTCISGESILFVMNYVLKSESTVRKKHNSVCYHEDHESLATDESVTQMEISFFAEFLTKVISR